MSLDVRIPKPSLINASAVNPAFRDLSRYVVSFTTQKPMGIMQAGTWEVSLVPQPDPSHSPEENMPVGVSVDNWADFIMAQIRLMDAMIVGIWGAHPVTGRYTQNDIMFGFVDNKFRSKQQFGDGIGRGVTLRGRDATKLFLVDNIAMAPELALNPEIVAAFDGDRARLEFMNFIRGLGPDGHSVFLNSHLPKAFYWLLANGPSMRLNMPMYGNVRKNVDLFLTDMTARVEDRIYDTALNMYAGTLAGYFAQMLDDMFYECWVDTMPATSPLSPLVRAGESKVENQTRPILFLRPKPYDLLNEVNSNGKAYSVKGVRLHANTESRLKGEGVEVTTLPTWEDLTSPIYGTSFSIPEEDILASGLGQNDTEVYSMFRCLGELDLAAQSIAGQWGYYYPLLDTKMFTTYGMRELSGRSKYMTAVWDAAEAFLTDADLTAWRQLKIEQAIKENSLSPSTPRSILDTGLQGDTGNMFDRFLNAKRGDVNDKALVTLLVTSKRDRLWRWNRYNHMLYSGTVRTKGRIVNVGSKVLLPDQDIAVTYDNPAAITRYRGLEAYCVNVGHEYAFGEGWGTSLSLIRGMNKANVRKYHDDRKFGLGANPTLNGIFTAAGSTQ